MASDLVLPIVPSAFELSLFQTGFLQMKNYFPSVRELTEEFFSQKTLSLCL
jgi:hypothetical protein